MEHFETEGASAPSIWIKTDLTAGDESLHFHTGPEVFLCTGGHVTVYLNGKKYRMIRNDCLAVSPGVLHWVAPQDQPQYTVLGFSGEFCSSMGLNPETLFLSPFVINSVFSGNMSQLRECWVNPNVPLGKVKARELAMRVLLELAERYREEPKPVDHRALERVKGTVAFFNERYHEKIGLEQAAQHLGVDKYALCRAFRQFTGRTPLEYLNHLRCSRAAQLIHQGQGVIEAMSQCAFTNRSYFARSFRKYYGCSPSEYKKAPQA